MSENQIKFTKKVRGIYTAPIGARELVLHRANGTGWRLSIRDNGAPGFGTDLRCVARTRPEGEKAAQRFAGSLLALSL